jgi:23S rRNA pseudouridine1911/1915/1917 synthase
MVGDRDYGGRLISRRDLRARSAGGRSREPRGDDAFDPHLDGPLIARQALHAHTISFAHPVSGERMELSAEPPADIADLLEALRTYRSE